MKADLPQRLPPSPQSQNPFEKVGGKPGTKAALEATRPNHKPLAGPDYKVDLSSAAKPQPTPPVETSAMPSLPSAPSLPEVSTPSSPDGPSVKVPDEIKKEATKEIQKVAKPEVKDGSVKKPAIIFVSGWQWMSSPSKSEGSYAGVGRMAEAVEGARLYGWDQKSEIIEQIKKTQRDQPVILVGHSLGGDTVVEVADELDTLEHNFRQVDLLVTLDAVGMSHDIAPQNVREHINVFGENDFFLNDGPHVARNHELTKVENILSPLDHTELDDDKDTQYRIVNAIQRHLKSEKTA